MVVDEIFSVAKSLLAIKNNFSKAKKERRRELANYFENISKCLEDTATELRAGNTPHGNCGKMLGYAQMFTKKVDGILDKDLAEVFSRKLVGAYKIEHALDGFEGIMANNLMTEVENQQRAYDTLALMEQASGEFFALADFIRPA